MKIWTKSATVGCKSKFTNVTDRMFASSTFHSSVHKLFHKLRVFISCSLRRNPSSQDEMSIAQKYRIFDTLFISCQQRYFRDLLV
jgi:hypothetical protein